MESFYTFLIIQQLVVGLLCVTTHHLKMWPFWWAGHSSAFLKAKEASTILTGVLMFEDCFCMGSRQARQCAYISLNQ
jgi:hypothetical protein